MAANLMFSSPLMCCWVIRKQEQIDAVLSADPENADLLALKAQLEEMIAVLSGAKNPQQV
jgi:hypothetical protein